LRRRLEKGLSEIPQKALKLRRRRRKGRKKGREEGKNGGKR